MPYAVFNDGFQKGDYDYLIVLHRKFSSVIHHFQDNEVFLQTEKDVINISPLGGDVYSFH